MAACGFCTKATEGVPAGIVHPEVGTALCGNCLVLVGSILGASLELGAEEIASAWVLLNSGAGKSWCLWCGESSGPFPSKEAQMEDARAHLKACSDHPMRAIEVAGKELVEAVIDDEFGLDNCDVQRALDAMREAIG